MDNRNLVGLCCICGLSMFDRGKCVKMSKLYDRSTIYVHYDCRKKYNENYFHGISMVELQDKKCEACGILFDPKTFTVNKHKKILHRTCIGAKCYICRKPVGQNPYCIYFDTNVYNSSKIRMGSNYRNDIRMRRQAKYIIHNKCIYNRRDVLVSESKLPIVPDDFWPNVCNKVTFDYFPKEFKSMTITFILVIYRLRSKTTINMDVLFKILNYCIAPAYFKHHNGFYVGIGCNKCNGPMAVTRFDVNICIKENCKYIKCKCRRCGDVMIYGASPDISCNPVHCRNKNWGIF